MERKSETERYYKVIFLNEIRNIVNDPDWWYATRAMSAFTLVVTEAIGAKYIVPTDIVMVYRILDKGEKVLKKNNNRIRGICQTQHKVV